MLAPIALIGGWTLAAHLQTGHFDPIRQTISALAARGSHDRFVMTDGLVVLGLCHLATARGLRPAALPGRLLLALGGLATIAVALFPQPLGGSSAAHTASATVAFLALSLWPVAGTRHGGPTVLQPRCAGAASAVMLALLVWFFLVISDADAGLAERFLAGAQSLWPLAVVLTTVRHRGQKRRWATAG